MYDINEIISDLKIAKYPKEPVVTFIYEKAREILINEENIIRVKAPVTVCGDIHGQLPDLLELFDTGGEVPFTNYLFLGDYVDRGIHGIETMLLLLCYKIKYPARITLLRGNHECREITQTYGFYDECYMKYDSPSIWRMFTELFDLLSLCAVIEGNIFCVHGGLSPDITLIDQISILDRMIEIPSIGTMTDLLWSDPDTQIDKYSPSPRGAGYLFGEKAVNEFIKYNRISLIARAHQLVMEGYSMVFNEHLVTVWSAPNYCYKCGNVASIMELDEYLNRNFKIFEATPEEYRTKTGLIRKKEAENYFL